MNRDELHSLVDRLPEGALESAKRVLGHLQIWPPAPPAEVQRAQQEQLERLRQSMKPGTSGSSGGGSSYTMGPGGRIQAGAVSSNRVEDGMSVVETVRFYNGHEITITERMRLSGDGKALIYVSEVAGPRGKTDWREITFDVAS
jgi:hypothetical protein